VGYTTTFQGKFTITPPLNPSEVTFMRKFSTTRRMSRGRGPLYVDGGGYAGQDKDADIHDYNTPPAGQPGLWCQWTVSDDGRQLFWDGGEKFYNATEWLVYIIDNLLGPNARAYIGSHQDESPLLGAFTCDHVLHGFVYAQGEEDDDRWTLGVDRNAVLHQTGHVTPR
jgi:hypothetical protein